MPTHTFNHIALSVQDVDRAVDFYQRVFDLEEINNPSPTSETRWLVFDGGIGLHLIPRPGLQVQTNKAVHFALSTAELDLFVEKLESLGIPYSDWHDHPQTVFVRADGIRQVYFQDPDGYWVEVNDDV